jgi:hypothetical protein
MMFPSSGQHGTSTLLLLLLLVAGCADGDGAADWGGTVETLPNGAIRVVNPPEGLWDAGDPWRLVPEMALGEVEGEEWEVFAAVIGLEADDQGRIYLLDRQANELRIFSPEGRHLRSVGRGGGGPGEYVNANGLEWLSPDTLLVIDQPGNRYSILTREGEYARSVPRRLGFYAWAFRGGLVGERIYELSSVPDGEGRHPALLGTFLGGEESPGSPDSLPWGFDPSSAASMAGDTVMLPVSDAPPYQAFSVRNERGGMGMAVPFAPSSVYHLDASGGIWHGHGSEARIYRSSMAGDTILEIVLDAEPTPVLPQELEEWAAGPAARQFREMGGDLDLGRIPEVKPFFDGLYLDPDGYLWVSVPAGPSEVVFAIVDPEGRYLGRLRVGGVERDVSVDPVVGTGTLYFVGRDELDVQRVYVFRVER